MMNREASRRQSTQQFMEDIAATTFANDFGTNSWKWSTMFIKHHGKIILDQPFLDIYNEPQFFSSLKITEWRN